MTEEAKKKMSNLGGQRFNKYDLCSLYSYCIDANYAKGTSFEQYLKKHRRQLIIEVVNERDNSVRESDC